jgi:hypothetical protein
MSSTSKQSCGKLNKKKRCLCLLCSLLRFLSNHYSSVLSWVDVYWRLQWHILIFSSTT